MSQLNHLLMVIICGLLLWAVNHYLIMMPLINLIFNCLMLVLIVVYIMQFLQLIRPVLPVPDLFK